MTLSPQIPGCLLIASLIAFGWEFTVRADDAALATAADRTFVHQAGLDGMFEVEASKLALAKDVSQDVKDFSANEIKDHDEVNGGLKVVAGSMGIAIPTHLDATFQKMYDSLKGKSGEAFDQEYFDDMVKLHENDEALFLKESQTTANPDMKDFAAKAGVIVQSHIDRLHEIEAKGVK